VDDQETSKNAGSLIDDAVHNFLTALAAQGVKLSVADVMRLLDLWKELARNEIREVRVRWVDSNPAPFVINT
jgi:2-polyprenyl-6-methoxyphenol hydroxylase-like FAD-dependent oxidoreductase